MNGSDEEPYTNPRAPVHIGKAYKVLILIIYKSKITNLYKFNSLVTGSAGCDECKARLI